MAVDTGKTVSELVRGWLEERVGEGQAPVVGGQKGVGKPVEAKPVSGGAVSGQGSGKDRDPWVVGVVKRCGRCGKASMRWRRDGLGHEVCEECWVGK